MSRPRISKLPIWERHEQRVVDLLRAALVILRGKTNLPQSEILLNRELYFCLLEANRNLWNLGLGGFDHPPISESHNPPDPDDEKRASRENKIPDFNWGYIDHLEPEPRRSARYYVIECKRLGKPPRTDWILTKNYVLNGIFRFITEEHSYAKGEKSGAMVGYVQSMELDDILDEINATCISQTIPPIDPPRDGWQNGGISFLRHQVARTFAVSPFKLTHFWIDVRK
jgi:hypothetical protein